MKYASLVFAGTVALISGQATAATIFQASLDGSQEVIPNDSTATGFATLTLNDDLSRLEISVQLTGVDLDGLQTPGILDDNVRGFHIHRGAIGINGPVVFGFINPNHDTNGDLVIDAVAGTVVSAWDLDEGNDTTLGDELANLIGGDLYFNLHTEAIPSGEIRGQIQQLIPAPSTLSVLMLGIVSMCVYRKGRHKSAGANTI